MSNNLDNIELIICGIVLVIFLGLMVLISGCIVSVPDESETPTVVPTAIPTTEPYINTSFSENITAPEPTPTKPEETPAPDTYNETVISFVKTTIPTQSPSGIKFVKVTPTPSDSILPPTETNITKINFTRYYDDDFSIDYPDTWKAPAVATAINSEGLYIPKTARIKTTSRVVTLDGRDNQTKFIATTTDFIVPGIYDLDPSIEWCRMSITPKFTDVSYTALSNYEKKFTTLYLTPYVTFDVVLPSTAKDYPYSYTERYLVSYNHYYIFQFITRGDLEEYKELRDHMLLSLKAEERAYVKS